MTVAALPAVVEYAEDGVSATFAVPFRFKSPTDLIVERILTDSRVVELTIGTDYTVSGGQTDAGGSVTRATATTGANLRIRRSTARAQAMRYPTGGRFPAESHEDALDRQMLIAQEQDAEQQDTRSRSLLAPVGAQQRDLTAEDFDGRYRILGLDPDTKTIVPKDGGDFAGKPGGNVMAVEPFTVMRAGSVPVPAGTNRVRTASFDTGGQPLAYAGAADYIQDDVVTPAYVAAHPLTSFRAPDETGAMRGFRLDEPVLTPQMLGARSDGLQSAHEVFLALGGTSRRMDVPPGDYLIDNTAIRQINYYQGELRFAPGARLIAIDQTKPLLYFYGGSPMVRGVTLTTRDVPIVRQLNAPMLLMTDCENAIISDVVVERGAGAGIVIIRGDGLRASNIIVENTLADGFDLFNANNFDISSVYVDGVGDDPFAVIDFLDGPQITRGLARGINVKNSNTRGITMPGPTGVILDGFTIEETQGSGLLIAQDASNGTRIPRGCKAANGNIKRSGQRVVDPDYSGQKYGIEVGESGAVDLDNITVVDGKTRGLAAFSGQADGRLSTNSIIVQNCGAEGIHVNGQRTWMFDNIYVEDTGGIGIYAHNVNRMVGGLRTAVRTAKTGGGNRAIHDDNITFMSVQHTHIADDQQNPTGFIYRNDGLGTGSAGSFTWAVNGVFYYSQAAPYIIVKGHGGPRLDGLIAPAANATIGPRDAFDRYTTGALSTDMNVVLADFGQYAGMTLSFTRYDVSGSSVVNLRDANNGGQIVTSIPAGGSPTKAVVWWDAAASPPQWRSAGKYPV